MLMNVKLLSFNSFQNWNSLTIVSFKIQSAKLLKYVYLSQ